MSIAHCTLVLSNYAICTYWAPPQTWCPMYSTCTCTERVLHAGRGGPVCLECEVCMSVSLWCLHLSSRGRCTSAVRKKARLWVNKSRSPWIHHIHNKHAVTCTYYTYALTPWGQIKANVFLQMCKHSKNSSYIKYRTSLSSKYEQLILGQEPSAITTQEFLQL